MKHLLIKLINFIIKHYIAQREVDARIADQQQHQKRRPKCHKPIPLKIANKQPSVEQILLLPL